MKTNNKGFAVLEALLIFVVVVIIGFVAYKVLQMRNANTKTATTPTQQEVVQAEPTVAPEIKKTADLDVASNELDKLNVDSELSEATKLQNEVNAL